MTDETEFEDEECKCTTSLKKYQFQELLIFCDPVPENNGDMYTRMILELFYAKSIKDSQVHFLNVSSNI